MASSGGGWCAGVALAATFALLCAGAARAQPRGGPGGGPGGGRPGFGVGGSFIRVGPGALQGQEPANPPGGAAHEPSSLRDMLFGARGARGMGPAPGRYQADDLGFVLDREGGDLALVRFENSPEVWALTAAPGPRGDVMFRNDAGETVLRATRIGGLTLFTDAHPSGVAAAVAGAAGPLRFPTSIGPQALLQALAQASARASRIAQHLVVFDAPDVRADTDWEFADAALVASEAFVRAAQKGAAAGRTACARFARVNLAQGRSPDVVAKGPVLRITVSPDRGPAGRPSSERIMLVITGR